MRRLGEDAIRIADRSTLPLIVPEQPFADQPLIVNSLKQKILRLRLALRDQTLQRCTITFSPFILLYWHSCLSFRQLGSAISQFAARNAVKTSRRRLARCRIPGLPHSVHFAARRGTIFHPRSFEGSSRTDLVLSPCDQWCTDGRNEASHCAGAGGLGGEDARADANEVDTGHCRRDHSGRSPGAGPGYKPPFSSSHSCGVREREPGANDFGSSGPIVRW